MVRAMGQLPVLMLVACCGSGPLAVSGCWTPETGSYSSNFYGTFYYCDDLEPSADACEDIEAMVAAGQVEICPGVSTIPQCTMATCHSTSGADGTLIIPDSVTAMSDGAFEKSKFRKAPPDEGIVAVQWGSGLTKIGKRAFWSGNLVSVDIPNGITEIGPSAFESNTALTSATIPASVQLMGRDMFTRCSALASLTLSSQLAATAIPSGFCRYCTALTSLVIPDGVFQVGSYAFAATTSLTSVTLGSGVTEIYEGAFQSSGLTEVSLPEGLKKLGDYVFEDSKICSFVLPASLQEIGSFNFDTDCAQTVQICAMGAPRAVTVGKEMGRIFPQCVVPTETDTSSISATSTSTGTDTATTATTSISATSISTGTDTATTVADTATTDTSTTTVTSTTLPQREAIELSGVTPAAAPGAVVLLLGAVGSM